MLSCPSFQISEEEVPNSARSISPFMLPSAITNFQEYERKFSTSVPLKNLEIYEILQNANKEIQQSRNSKCQPHIEIQSRKFEFTNTE